MRNGDPKQLLKCDIVYVRQLVELEGLSDHQVKKLPGLQPGYGV
jgi:hypothetical protein